MGRIFKDGMFFLHDAVGSVVIIPVLNVKKIMQVDEKTIVFLADGRTVPVQETTLTIARDFHGEFYNRDFEKEGIPNEGLSWDSDEGVPEELL